jgi:hypothetical protein
VRQCVGDRQSMLHSSTYRVAASRWYTAMGCASLCNVAFTQAMLQAYPVHRVGNLRSVIRPILFVIGWIFLNETGGG